MIKILQFITVLLSFMTLPGIAQDITRTNLSWRVSRMETINTGVFDDHGGTIVSYGAERLEWLDAQGSVIQTLIVQEVNGDWTSVKRDGIVLYETESEGKPVIVTFERSNGMIRITIAVMMDDGFPMIREFSISNFTTL